MGSKRRKRGFRKVYSIIVDGETEKYYKSSNDIYKKLKPNLSNAIDNSEKLGEFSLEEPNSAMAEMSQIFDLIFE